jgi:hypothetical protein
VSQGRGDLVVKTDFHARFGWILVPLEVGGDMVLDMILVHIRRYHGSPNVGVNHWFASALPMSLEATSIGSGTRKSRGSL